MKTFIPLLLLITFVSTSQACDDFSNEMSNQTVIMQQQLNQQRQAASEQKQTDYQANINAQRQVQQERFNTFSTNMILLDGQNRR
jgi:hypothetical protein